MTDHLNAKLYQYISLRIKTKPEVLVGTMS